MRTVTSNTQNDRKSASIYSFFKYSASLFGHAFGLLILSMMKKLKLFFVIALLLGWAGSVVGQDCGIQGLNCSASSQLFNVSVNVTKGHCTHNYNDFGAATVTVSGSASYINAQMPFYIQITNSANGYNSGMIQMSGVTHNINGQAANGASAPGQQNLQVVVWNKTKCCSRTITRHIPSFTLVPTVTANGSSGSISICSGSSVSLVANDTYHYNSSGITYTWTQGASGSGKMKTVYPTSNTTYKVRSSVGGCYSPNEASVTVYVTPKPNISLSITSNNTTPCEGANVTLTASGGSSYTWSGGASGSGNQKHITVPSYSQTYTVSSGSGACSDSKSITIYPKKKPGSASISPSSATVCQGSSVSLSANASNATSYTWSNNGASGSGNPKNVYPSGNGYVYVTPKNECGNGTGGQVYITVNPKPSTPTIFPSNPTVCKGNTVTLSASSGDASSYSWSGSGAYGSSSSTSFTANNSGSVQVTASNSCGISSPASTYVTVNPKPGTPTISGNNPVCKGVGTNYSASANGATSYSWTWPDNPPTTGPNITIYPNSSANLTVKAINQCGETSQSKYITVNDKPSKPVISGNTTACSGQPLTLSASSTNADNYVWTNHGTNGTTSSGVTFTPTSNGPISVLAQNICGNSLTESANIIVNNGPTYSTTADGVATSTITVCPGVPVVLGVSGDADSYTWNNSLGAGTSHTVSPTTETTYTVTGTKNGCTGEAKSITVKIDGSLLNISAWATPSGAICAGQSVQLEASGATTYSWDNGLGTGATKTVSPTTTTTYKVTATKDGCSGDKEVKITVNPKPTVVPGADKLTVCAGGTVVLSASGAASYVWKGGGVTKVGSPVEMKPNQTTTYTVIGTSADGCKDTNTIEITATPANFTVTLDASKTTICEGETVKLTRGGTAPIYEWSGGGLSGSQVEKNVTPTNTTTYVITGKNSAGCEIEEEVTITVNPVPVAWSFGMMPNGPICSGEEVSLNAIGDPTWIVVWTSGVSGIGTIKTDNPVNITNAPIDVVYTAHMEYDGCKSVPKSHTMSVRPKPTTDVDASKSAICEGETVKLTRSGTATSYVWSGGSISGGEEEKTVSPNQTTTYKVVGSNVYNCKDSAEVTITVTPKPIVTLVPSVTEICPEKTFTLTADGADSYTWTAGISGSGFQRNVTSPAIDGVVTYKVKGTKNGCTSDEKSVDITVHPTPEINVTATNDQICAGESTQINISGQPNYTYSASEGTVTGTGAQRKMNVSPETPTIYTITATNIYGCQVDEPITIDVTPKPVITLEAEEYELCLGEEVELTVSGNATTYTWTAGISGQGATRTHTPQNAGDYTYKVKGTKNGCVSDEKEVTVVIKPTTEFTLSAQPEEFCAGTVSTVELTIDGKVGYTYTITGGPLQGSLMGSGKKRKQLLKPTETTIYSVTGVNPEGCEVSEPITITVHPTPDATFSGDNVVCVGESITLTPNTLGGTWTSTVPSRATVEEGEVTGVSTANSGSSTVTIKYEVEENGCKASATKQITVREKPKVNLIASSIVHVKCHGASTGVAKVNVTKGKAPYTYDWNGASASTTNTANDLAAGDHTLTVTDDYGCPAEVQIEITEPIDEFLAEVESGDVVEIKCFNGTGSATVTASGGTPPYKYKWDNGSFSTSPTATNLSAGNHDVIVEDKNKCQTNFSISLDEPDELQASADSQLGYVKCHGDATESVEVTVSGGTAPYSYDWGTSSSSTSNHADNIAAGTHKIKIADANGCEKEAQVTITQPDEFIATVVPSSVVNVKCYDQSNGQATINVVGGKSPYTYNWGTSSTSTSNTATDLKAGTHKVKVTDNNDCETDVDVVITQPDVLSAEIKTADITHISCHNSYGSATVTVTGGTGSYTYNWGTSSTSTSATATDLNVGTHKVKVADANGCEDEAQVTITQPNDALSAEIKTTDITQIDCHNGTGSATVTVTGGASPYSYNWGASSTSTSATAPDLNVGTHKVKVTDANGCEKEAEVTLIEPTELNVSLSKDNDIACQKLQQLFWEEFHRINIHGMVVRMEL